MTSPKLSPPQVVSPRWQHLGLLAMLTTAVLLGIVALQWQVLAPMWQLALVAAALVASAAGGAFGSTNLHGRLAVVLAGVLFGVLLLVHAHRFGTGTDAWEIYALWTLALAGFAALARLQVGWMLWLALLHFTTWAFLHQEVSWDGFYTAVALPWVAGLAVVYALVVVIGERRARQSGDQSCKQASERPTLVIHTALAIGLWTLARIAFDAIESSYGTELWEYAFLWRSAAVVLALLALTAVFVAYTRFRRDLFSVTLAAVGTGWIATALLHRLLVRLDFRLFEHLPPLALAIAVQVWAFRRWCRRGPFQDDATWQPLGVGRALALAAAVGLVVTVVGWRYIGPMLQPTVEPWVQSISRLDYTFFFWPTTGLAAAVLTLIVLRWWTLRRGEAATPLPPQPRLAPIALAVLVVACLAIPGVQIYQRQQILETGRPLLLELSPATIEQLEDLARESSRGTYVDLRFLLHDGTISPASLPMRPRRGLLVLDVDEQGVGEYFTFFRGWELGEQQQRLRYRRRKIEPYGAELRFGVESYFVGRERASELVGVRYAELRGYRPGT